MGSPPCRTFVQSIPEVLQYPFTSNGIWTLLIGTLLYVVLAYTAKFDLRVAVVASGYLLAYLLKIVVAASTDEPDFSGLARFREPVAGDHPPLSNRCQLWNSLIFPIACLSVSTAQRRRK